MDSVGFWSPVLEDSSLDALLEPLRAVLGSRLGRLEAILGRLASWAVLNRSWAILAALPHVEAQNALPHVEAQNASETIGFSQPVFW